MRMENIKTENIASESTLPKYCNVLGISCLDSEHDDAEVIKLHQNQNKHFIIKRNLRNEVAGHWLLLANCIGTCQILYEGKNRYIGVANHMNPVEREDLGSIFIVFELIERTIKANGQELLYPEVEVNTWWTSLPEEPEVVIHLYYKHVSKGNMIK